MLNKRHRLSMLVALLALLAPSATPAVEPAGGLVARITPALQVQAQPGQADPAAPRARRSAAERRAAQRRSTAAEARREAAAPGPAVEAGTPTASETAVAIDQAIAVVAEAVSAARASASAASASATRIASLQTALESARSQAARSDDSRRWLWPLLATVGLLLAIVALLAWRLARARSEQARWETIAGAALTHTPAAGTPALPRPGAPSPSTLAGLPPPSTLGAASKPSAAADAWHNPALQATRPFDRPGPSERTDVLPPRTPPRDVSVEELIDLEQQAEFFIVLGQDEAAIELLAEHTRHTGGGSPLPYLKLLEIYHRRGDHAAYERARTRFNQRFNAYAPEWGADLAAGRSLESYAGIVPRLQQAWPRPPEAMAEMEALLFRKASGELFDLPAYRELLFLYSLARDLHDRETEPGDGIDVLLPLMPAAEGRSTDFGATAPLPFLQLADDRRPTENRPTQPVDFDISTAVGERPASIFDAAPRKR